MAPVFARQTSYSNSNKPKSYRRFTALLTIFKTTIKSWKTSVYGAFQLLEFMAGKVGLYSE